MTINKALTPAALWAFMAGRGTQEKRLAALKGKFAVPVAWPGSGGARSCA